MSEESNKLLHLFSKLLRTPAFMMAVRSEFISQEMKKRDNRRGASGLLDQLWEKDGLTNAEIAELLDIRPSSVTAQVKQLEETGFVERRTDENDKRVSRVFLTEKGREAKGKRSEFHDDLSDNVFSALTDEEQIQLADLLKKLIDSLADKDFDFADFFKNFDFSAYGPHELHRMGREFKKHFRADWENHGRNQNMNPEDFFKQFGPGPRRSGHPGRPEHPERPDFGPGFSGGRPDFPGNREKDDSADNWDDF